MKDQAELLRDFHRFAAVQVASGDIDPAYPVLRLMGPAVCESDDERIGFTLLYVAYYSLTSALRAWRSGYRLTGPPPESILSLPCATERRGHRSQAALRNHLLSLVDLHEGFGSWGGAFYPMDGTTPTDAWQQLQADLQKVNGNGRWAAYKTGEILKTVHGWPVQPTDAGHAFSTGPRAGLAVLFPDTAKLRGVHQSIIDQLDGYTLALVDSTGLPVEQVETCLCDFHALVGGRYYVGHDIDDQLLQAQGVLDREDADLLAAARVRAFSPQWRSELWPGRLTRRNHLLTYYARTGRLEWWRQ